jgi:hypothetical protein
VGNAVVGAGFTADQLTATLAGTGDMRLQGINASSLEVDTAG